MASIDAIVNRQLLRWEKQREKSDRVETRPAAVPRIVTVSRQLGSRGSYVAQRLSEKLGYQHLHREIIDAICQSSGYRKRLIAALDDRFRSRLEVLVEALVTGQSVDHTDYHRHLCRIVLSLSQLGGVVLTGRAGSFILGPKRGFHLRLIAPKKDRIANLVTYKGLTESEAAKQIELSDAERKELVARLFRADNDDARQYDLVINTASVEVEDLPDFIMPLIERKFRRLTGSR